MYDKIIFLEYRTREIKTTETPVVEHGLEREIAQWVHMKDRTDDLLHHKI